MTPSEFIEKIKNNVTIFAVIVGFGIGAGAYCSLSAPSDTLASEPSTVASASSSASTASVGGGEGGAGGEVNCQGGAGEGGDPMVENAVDVVQEMDWVPVEEDPMMDNPSQRCPLDPLCELGDDAT